MAAAADGHGYWLVAADGGVFSFGSAPFFGSAAGTLHATVAGAIAATPDGRGYWLLPVVPPPPPPPPGPVSWTVPGSTIYNLDGAPGSPWGRGARVVALTFDDGPSPVYTPQILQVLTGRGAVASFQVVGYEAAQYPSIIAREAADGMPVANHTWSHVDLTTLAPSAWTGEVDRTSALITGITHRPVSCTRPPYGASNATVTRLIGQRGMANLLWDVNPADYTQPGTSAIVSRVLSTLHPGAIIGMHDGGGNRSQTVAALPAIIDGIRAAGYTIVPVC
jgi:peptidoglycan/xylan/chitin deacetylase (PgdA/CDA1 family)